MEKEQSLCRQNKNVGSFCLCACGCDSMLYAGNSLTSHRCLWAFWAEHSGIPLLWWSASRLTKERDTHKDPIWHWDKTEQSERGRKHLLLTPDYFIHLNSSYTFCFDWIVDFDQSETTFRSEQQYNLHHFVFCLNKPLWHCSCAHSAGELEQKSFIFPHCTAVHVHRQQNDGCNLLPGEFITAFTYSV